jgi:hypothetical protein
MDFAFSNSYCKAHFSRESRGREHLIYEGIEQPAACIKKPDVNKAPRSGRLIRPRLAGFEVTGSACFTLRLTDYAKRSIFT